MANQGTANPEAGPQMSLLSPAKRDKAVPDVPNSGCLRVGGGGGAVAPCTMVEMDHEGACLRLVGKKEYGASRLLLIGKQTQDDICQCLVETYRMMPAANWRIQRKMPAADWRKRRMWPAADWRKWACAVQPPITLIAKG